jgi:hypothetical protein
VAVGLTVVVLLAAGITLIVTAKNSNSSSNATSNPTSVAGARVARRLERAALKSTIDGGSFHYVSHFTQQGQTQVTVGDAGPASGKQVITIGPDTFTVLVNGAACYFQGDARQLTEQLGLPQSLATAHAGQWISLAPGDVPYQSVYVAVTTNSALHANIAFAPRQESSPTTRNGYRVLGITGPLTNMVVAGQTQEAKGTASLFVTRSRPHLPVEYTESGKIDKVKSKLVMTFSRWGEAVSVTAPPNAVSYSSLGAGNLAPPTTSPPVLTAAPG